MKAKYIKEHNNYDLTLGNIYEATFYKEGWLLIKNDDIGNSVLYRDKCFEREEFSTDEAAIYALRFCEKHPGWKRICDIENTESLYKAWEELAEKDKKPWIKDFGILGAMDAWKELGVAPCKVQYGFISGNGKFYKRVTDVPRLHNLMMVFKVS